MTDSVQHFETARMLIEQSQEAGLLKTPTGLSGFSGEKLIGSLQRLAKHQADSGHGCYLEVGVFQGLTLISTALALDGYPAFGIDNFSQFDSESRNRALIASSSAANGTTNAHLIDSDYEIALMQLPGLIGDNQVGLYFVDGPHDYRSQLLCLELAERHLSENAIIVVDDSNYRHVRLANRDFLWSHPDYRLFFEAYTNCHPMNMTGEGKAEAERGWWNGVNVLVKDVSGILAPMFPEVPDDRTLYQNEHFVHTEKYACLSVEAVALAGSIADVRPLKAIKQALGIIRAARSPSSKERIGPLKSLNTYSSDLPGSKFNPGLSRSNVGEQS